MNINITLLLLIVSIISTLSLIFLLVKSKEKNQIKEIFLCNLFCVLICTTGQALQISFADKLGIPPIYFDYIVYIGTCFLPVSIFFTGLIFYNTKLTFKRIYLLLFIIPIISLLVLWTNDFHGLFYKHYSVDYKTNLYGPYFIIHNIYSYILMFLGIFYLLKFSIKNSGLFSKQSILILFAISIPLIVNILGTFQIIPMSIYITPITFTAAFILLSFAILKFSFLGVAPIALQKIADKMSDSYLVLNDNGIISDFNKTFLTTFSIKDNEIRGKAFYKFLNDKNISSEELISSLERIKSSDETISFEYAVPSINKVFTIEINTIYSDKASLGTLILFKDITQHIEDMKKIQDAQESLMEGERLSSLGQLIGGIAHNLKTPIMSISGAAEGLSDLVKEYDSSIGDPEVNDNDHHDIAKDMNEWVSKIKEYTEYMSDIITAVKGQAVALSETENISFDVDELVKRVEILMKHELKNAIVYMNTHLRAPKDTKINGDIGSLVQVINNMISNAIQSYNGKPEEKIDFIIDIDSNNNLVISVKDYGSGLPEKVKNKLFKEMITTKGKNGTGLGLYMSYSTIRAHFNGNITYETESGQGTQFNVILPL